MSRSAVGWIPATIGRSSDIAGGTAVEEYEFVDTFDLYPSWDTYVVRHSGSGMVPLSCQQSVEAEAEQWHDQWIAQGMGGAWGIQNRSSKEEVRVIESLLYLIWPFLSE